MVMWHIKLKEKISRPGYTEKIYPRIKLVTLGWGQKVKYHLISLRAWGFAMAGHRMCSSFLAWVAKQLVLSKVIFHLI